LTNVIPIEIAHFWSKVEIGGPAMCWLWTGATKGRDGLYGKFREHTAHRYAYQLHRGPIPDGLMVRHMCGNKRCVNPAHLELGTAQDNYRDRFRLGEGTGGVGGQGETNSRSKLSAPEVRYIIVNPDRLTGRQLARKFSVSPATICLIRKGERWKHVA
jgi:hypothetical protein